MATFSFDRRLDKHRAHGTDVTRQTTTFRAGRTELPSDQGTLTATAGSSTGFVERALAFYAAHGIVAKRLMTDNGFAYVKN